MPPPPRPKRIKRPKNVIDEDVYTNALDHIVRRDFFPGLAEATAQTDYLDAIKSHDKSWIRQAGQRLTQVMTPGPESRYRRGTSLASTVRGSVTGTPARESTVGTEQDIATSNVDTSLSLDGFQAKYVSEDNESFDALLDAQNLARANKYAFLYNGNKIPGPHQIEYRRQEQKLLADTAEAKASGALVPLASVDLRERNASYDTVRDRSGPRNTFMFDPESIEDTHTTLSQLAQDNALAAPKAVVHAATRFDAVVSQSTQSIPASPSMSAIDAALSGNPRPTASEAYSGSETPRVQGYAFVDAEPTDQELAFGVPVDEEAVERTEHAAAMALMPRLEALPSEPHSGEKSTFKLQAKSNREKTLAKLVEKADLARRAKERRGNAVTIPGLTPAKSMSRLGSATPRFESYARAGRTGGGGLTPAGRMLAASLVKTPARGEMSGATPVSRPRGTPARSISGGSRTPALRASKPT